MAEVPALNGKRCFILGAGASKCCGLPLASELTGIVCRSMWNIDPEVKCWEATIPTSGDFMYDAMQDTRRKLSILFPTKSCESNNNNDFPDFEALITALDEVDKFREHYGAATQTFTSEWTDSLKRDLLKEMCECFCEFTTAITDEQWKSYESFVSQLRPGLDSVVSFNWDLLVEIAAQRTNAPLAHEHSTTAILLIKPHGTLDRVEVPLDEYESAKASENVHSLLEEARFERHGTTIVRLICPDKTDIADRLVGPFTAIPLLVEPSSRKIYESPWLHKQWATALDLLREADEWNVAGFSLPPADIRPKLLMQLALIGREPSPQVNLVLPTDEDGAVRERFRSALGFDVNWLAQRFEEWVDRLSD